MKYGILPHGKVDGAFTWRFHSAKEAKRAASELCAEHHTEVYVFEMIGSYKPTVEWEPQSNGGKE